METERLRQEREAETERFRQGQEAETERVRQAVDERVERALQEVRAEAEQQRLADRAETERVQREVRERVERARQENSERLRLAREGAEQLLLRQGPTVDHEDVNGGRLARIWRAFVNFPSACGEVCSLVLRKVVGEVEPPQANDR